MFCFTHTKKNQQPVNSKSAEIMDQLSAIELDQPETSRSAALRNDCLSQVLGEDRHGHVHTFGLGPSPSDVFGPQPTRMEYKRMADQAIKSSEEHVHAMEEQMSILQKTVEDMTMQIVSMKMAMQSMPNLQDHNMSTAQRMCPQVQSRSFQPSPSTQLKHSDLRAILKRKKQSKVKKTKAKAMRVDLLNFRIPEEVMAQGRVISKDPNKDVGGFRLGPDFWEVYVEIAINEDEFLIRPRGHFLTIKEVVGSTIAWPSSRKW